MTKKPLVFAIWALVPLTTFFLGMMLRPNTGPDNDPKKLTAKKYDSILPGLVDQGTKVSQNKNRNKTGPASRIAGEPVSSRTLFDRGLNSSEIEIIGNQIKTELNPIKRRHAFTKLLEGMTLDNAKEMREQIKHFGSRSSEFRDFHYAWGAMAGAEAVINGTKTSEKDVHATMTGWASTSPGEAVAWFEGLDQKDEKLLNKEYLKSSIVDGLANADPDRAIDFILNLTQSGDKNSHHLIHDVARKISRTMSLEEAGAWAASLPNEMAGSAISAMTPKFAYSDPESAAKWAAELPSNISGPAIHKVGEAWAHRDPASSVEWLNSLPPGQGVQKGLESALHQWAGRDPKAASDHLVTMTNSPERDLAIRGFSSRIAHEDPQSALIWADTISDENTRNGAIIQAGQAFVRRDNTAAREWLETSGLPIEIQQKIKAPRR